MTTSVVRVLRRHVLLLAVVGMAIFLWDQGSRFPESRQEIHAVSLTVNDAVVYSAANDDARATGAVFRWRVASLLCWAVAIAWVGLLAWRQRSRFRAVRPAG